MALNLKDNIIEFNGKTYPIESWAVWFMTPMGLFQDQQEAVQRVGSNDMDPTAMVIPVPVALGPDGLYEVFSRM